MRRASGGTGGASSSSGGGGGIASQWRGEDFSAAQLKVLFIGDSNINPNSGLVTTLAQYPERIRNELVRAEGLASISSGLIGMWRSEWSFAGTITGGSGNFSCAPWGMGRTGVQSGTTNQMILAVPAAFQVAGTMVDVHAPFDGGLIQDLQYATDGGTVWTAVGLGNATGRAGSAKYYTKTIGPFTLGTTLRFRGANGTFGSALFGVELYTSATTGIRRHNIGRGGMSLRDIAGSTTDNQLGNYGIISSGDAVDDRMNVIDRCAPHLVVVALGQNDIIYLPADNTESLPAQAATPVAVLSTMWDRLAARVQSLGADLVIVSPSRVQAAHFAADKYYVRDGIPYPWDDYVNAARSVAGTRKCRHVALDAFFGTWADSNAAGYQADFGHLSVAGHKKAAAFVSQSLRAS